MGGQFHDPNIYAEPNKLYQNKMTQKSIMAVWEF